MVVLVDQTRLEAAPVIDNAQLNRVRPADQLHVGVPRAAMLDHISEAFLHDAIEAQGCILGYYCRHLVVSEVDRQAVGLSQSLAQATDGCHKPKLFQVRRMESMRHAMHGRRQLLDLGRQLAHSRTELGC